MQLGQSEEFKVTLFIYLFLSLYIATLLTMLDHKVPSQQDKGYFLGERPTEAKHET